MRALNSRAAKISEKWAMLHFPLEDKQAQAVPLNYDDYANNNQPILLQNQNKSTK